MQTIKDVKYFICLLFVILFTILIIGCDDSVKPEPFTPLEVDIRMEIQILDSTYQLYSRPHTEIYFNCYIKKSDGSKYDIYQSDTTSCRNGWGVKLLNFTFEDPADTIVLGASCENYEGPNYREVFIDYNEAERRIDSTNHASITKTFAIYYK